MRTKNNNIITSSQHSGLLLMAFVILGLTLSSCSDDSSIASPEPEPDEALYAVYWRLDTPDGRTNYVSLVNDLMGGEVNPAEALEVPGRSRFYAQPQSNYFLIGNGENLTFTKYKLSEEGSKFKEGEKFSLANEGVTSLQARTVFLSDTKAYYIDNTQGQVVVFNLEKIENTASLDLIQAP